MIGSLMSGDVSSCPSASYNTRRIVLSSVSADESLSVSIGERTKIRAIAETAMQNSFLKALRPLLPKYPQLPAVSSFLLVFIPFLSFRSVSLWFSSQPSSFHPPFPLVRPECPSRSLSGPGRTFSPGKDELDLKWFQWFQGEAAGIDISNANETFFISAGATSESLTFCAPVPFATSAPT